MQKFGLQSNRSSHHTAIELAIAKEQASALGRAGRKLRISLEQYEQDRHKGLSAQDESAQIAEISENVWALVLQREFLGFTVGNLVWIEANYVIPRAAIDRLGV